MKLVEKDRSYFLEYKGDKQDVNNIETWEFENISKEVYYFYITEDSVFDKDSTFYDSFKEQKISQLPEGILLEFWKDRIAATKPKILESITFPFRTFSFVKLNNSLITRFSFYKDEYRDLPERWKIKTSVDYFVGSLRSQSAVNDNLEIFEDEELLILQFITDDDKSNIGDIHKENFRELEYLVHKTETDILGLKRFNDFLSVWNANKTSNDEKNWQRIIKNHSWIISQLFSSPLIMLEDEAFLGGKSLNNKHSNLIDFVYQNKLNSNILLIEIKTPATKLIGKKYRNTHQLSSELSGSINQVLNYRQSVLNEFYSLYYNTDNKFEVSNPKSLLLIGCLSALTSSEKKTFEIFRNELKNIDILTFDELFEKTNNLLKLLKE